MMKAVLNPQKVVDVRKAENMIDSWEEKVVKMKIEYLEEISPRMKIALLYAMLPKELQDRILDKCAVIWSKTTTADFHTYISIKEDVKNISKSRKDQGTPQPMDGVVFTNHVQYDWRLEGAEDSGQLGAGGYDQCEDVHVDYIGKGKGKG